MWGFTLAPSFGTAASTNLFPASLAFNADWSYTGSAGANIPAILAATAGVP
ncbi:MAG: hypothetical protein ABIY52_12470 [Gemmatimonadaceae bacterium]